MKIEKETSGISNVKATNTKEKGGAIYWHNRVFKCESRTSLLFTLPLPAVESRSEAERKDGAFMMGHLGRHFVGGVWDSGIKAAQNKLIQKDIDITSIKMGSSVFTHLEEANLEHFLCLIKEK